MKYSIVLLLLAVLVANFGEIYAVQGKHSDYLNKNAGSVDCFDAYENCRKIPECMAALRVLNKKCKFANGRCRDDSQLERCGEVADKLFMYGFEKKRCKCEKKIERCFELHNKIYANPCFEETRNVIDHRKNNQTHPQDEITTKYTTQKNLIDVKPTAEPKSQGLASLEEDDRQQVEIEAMQNQESVFESSPPFMSTIPTSKTTSKSHRPKQRRPKGAIAVSKDEPVFGDEGFGKPPPQRRTSPKIHKEKAEKIAKLESSRKHEKMPSVLDEVKMTTAIHDDWTTDATEESTAAPARQQEYRIKLEDTSWEMTTDMKYRIIFIALGSVLVLAILATMFYLAWEKIRRIPFSYKHGKIVIQNNGGVA